MNARFEKAAKQAAGRIDVGFDADWQGQTAAVILEELESLSKSYAALQAVAAAAAKYRLAENAEQSALALAELHGAMNALPDDVMAALKGNP